MQNNRTLVFGNLYGIPNTWERKYKEDVNAIFQTEIIKEFNF
jgi:hypothetical protein